MSHGTVMAEMPSSRPTMGAKAKIMMVSFKRHLRQGEQRVAVGQPAPDEDHRRAGRGGEQDEAGDVAVELVGRQVGREDGGG